MMIFATTVLSPICVMASDVNTYCEWATIQECRANKKAPVIEGTEGKVFAGWYKDSAYKNELKASEQVDGAFAKFVDPLTLTAKCQISATTTATSKKTNLRIVTTVDSLNYQSVGFDVTIGGKEASLLADTVYHTIYGYTDGNKVKYTPSVTFENDDSKYFMVYELQNIPSSVFEADIKIIPRWTTLDGIVVTGEPKDTSILEGIKLKDENVLGTYDYSLSKGTIDFSLVDKINAADIKTIRHEDGVVISHSVSGDVVTISEDAILNAEPKTATGAVTNVIISTKTDRYVLPLKVVTLAIRTTDDFYNLSTYFDSDTKTIEGYYVLSNDLNFTGLSDFDTFCGAADIGKTGTDANLGWCATFDGQNHVIKNLSLKQEQKPGIFGNISTKGVVKNVAFTGAVNKAYGGYVCDGICGTVENVYVEGKCTQTAYKTTDKLWGMGTLFARDISISYATIKDITVMATGNWTTYNRALATNGSAVDGTTVVIGLPENQILGTYTTIADIQEANANIKAFNKIFDVIDDDLSVNGSATYTINNGFVKIYFGNTCVYQVANEVLLDSYDYSLGRTTIDFSLIDGVNAADIISLEHEDGTAISYTLDGNVATISGDSILNADKKTATGATTTVVVTTELAKYKLPLRVVTLAIRTTNDFYSLSSYVEDKQVNGYFVLCNDLDFTGLAGFDTYCGSKQVGTGGNVGWRATFDGQNHVISNLTLNQAWNSGIFGLVGFTGVVKDVAFAGAVNKAYGGYLFENIYGTVENVYVEGICTQTSYKNANQLSMMGSLFSNSIGYTGATIKNITVIATGNWATYNRALASSGSAVDGTTVVIGLPENQILADYTTINAIQEANANIKAYKTIFDAVKDNLSANGSVTYAIENRITEIYFGDTCVYQVANEVLLDSYDYSLGRTTIDFSLIDGVNAADIISLEHEDGTAISYTLDGNVATISGDSILNADKKTATGATTTVVVTTELAKYKLPLRVVTLAIRTTNDFYSLSSYVEDKQVNGYFVLCNDLDFTGLAGFDTYCGSKQVGTGGNVGWRATFDGQNHVISNLTLNQAWNSGIFGLVGFTGVVKDVAFAGAVNKAYGGYLFENIYGTVENVYVEGICTQTSYKNANQLSMMGSLFSNSIGYTGATIKNITVIATGNWATYNRALASSGSAVDGTTVVIGLPENQILADYTTINAIQEANANIKAYTTAANAASANLSANGSATFNTEDNSYVILWNGKEVYRVSVN